MQRFKISEKRACLPISNVWVEYHYPGKRLDWHFPFGDLLGQPLLIDNCLASFRGEIEDYARTPPDIVAQAILLWRILHYRILRYRLKHPDWIFIRHEDLSARPEREFRKLFTAIGLDFKDHVRRTLQAHCHPENPAEADEGVVHQLKRDSRSNIWNWTRRLGPADILRIRRDTEDVSHHFYADADWRPPAALRVRVA